MIESILEDMLFVIYKAKLESERMNLMQKEQITSKNAPAAIGPYSQAVRVGDLIYTSGQLPINVDTGEMETDVRAATVASLKNIESILKEAGSDLSKVVKTTVFIKNMDDFGIINEAYAEFFEGIAPARSCVEVARLPKDAVLEIEAVAHI